MRFNFKTKIAPNPDLQEKLHWLRLTRTDNVGPITFYRLLENFGSAGAALEALPEMAKRGGRSKPLKSPEMGLIEREYEQLTKLGGDLLTAADDAYPDKLLNTDGAPPVLSILGNPALMSQSCLAIVGARNASVNGRKFSAKIARELGQMGQVIVSGLARGIDTAAHQGALDTGTIAVVAGGIDVVYPEENQALYEAIKERGLVIAESPFGQQPFAQSFPKRNRIVSGLSSGVVVVEATRKSGSLITARLAGEQGRDVMAVPGHPLDPRAAGPNHLIREGAILVQSATDIIEALSTYSTNAFEEPAQRHVSFSQTPSADMDYTPEAQNEVLAALSFTPITVDELIRACHLSVPAVQTILLELELAGRVKRFPGNQVSLID